MSDGFVTNILLAILTILMTFFGVGIVGELYIRTTKPYWTINMATKFNPTLFSKHIFEQKKHHHVRLSPRREIYINSLGFRDKEFQKNKPENQLRILIYGGSQVFDTQADTRSDWPNRTESHLKDIFNQDVQIINAGIPGHKSHDSLGRLYSRGHFFEPDYTVICNAWNDLKEFYRKKPLLLYSKEFIYRGNLRRNYINSLDRFLGENSQFYTRLRINLVDFFMNVGAEGQTKGTTFDKKIHDKQLRQYKLTMQTFVEISRDIGAKPILMTQPRLVSEHNTPQEKQKIKYYLAGYKHNKLIKAFRLTDKKIREVSNQKKVPLFDANRFFTGKNSLFADHIHLTPRGSKKLSNKLGNFISKLHQVP